MKASEKITILIIAIILLMAVVTGVLFVATNSYNETSINDDINTTTTTTSTPTEVDVEKTSEKVNDTTLKETKNVAT